MIGRSDSSSNETNPAHDLSNIASGADEDIEEKDDNPGSRDTTVSKSSQSSYGHAADESDDFSEEQPADRQLAALQAQSATNLIQLASTRIELALYNHSIHPNMEVEFAQSANYANSLNLINDFLNKPANWLSNIKIAGKKIQHALSILRKGTQNPTFMAVLENAVALKCAAHESQLTTWFTNLRTAESYPTSNIIKRALIRGGSAFFGVLAFLWDLPQLIKNFNTPKPNVLVIRNALDNALLDRIDVSNVSTSGADTRHIHQKLSLGAGVSSKVDDQTHAMRDGSNQTVNRENQNTVRYGSIYQNSHHNDDDEAFPTPNVDIDHRAYGW